MSAHRIALAWLVLIAALPLACRRPDAAKPPETQPKTQHPGPSEELDDAAAEPEPATATPTETAPTAPATTQPDDPNQLVVTVSSPKDPQRGWLVIEAFEKADKPATAIGQVVGPRKVLVTTDNVKRIKILLARAGLPTNRSVILRIDNQGIEITGRRGPIAAFERSLQGVWSPAKRK